MLALAQAFAPSMDALAFIRFLLDIPRGTDVAVGFIYIIGAFILPEVYGSIEGRRTVPAGAPSRTSLTRPAA